MTTDFEATGCDSEARRARPELKPGPSPSPTRSESLVGPGPGLGPAHPGDRPAVRLSDQLPVSHESRSMRVTARRRLAVLSDGCRVRVRWNVGAQRSSAAVVIKVTVTAPYLPGWVSITVSDPDTGTTVTAQWLRAGVPVTGSGLGTRSSCLGWPVVTVTR